jgi:uncharacterized protein (TIGR03083 family)
MSYVCAADHSGTTGPHIIREILVIRRGFGDEYCGRKTVKEAVTSEELPPEIGALLASLAEQTPSNDASVVLDAALAARPATPVQQPPTDSEVAAFGRAVDDVQRTLVTLTADDWTRPAVNGLTVGELVGHLIGTQHLMAAEFGLAEPITDSTDHIESTRDAIAVGAASTPAEAAGEFARASAVVTNHLAGLDAHGLATESRFGTIVAAIDFVLVVRIFELWTHDNDLRRSVGLPPVEPDPDRLWMMTRTVMPVVDRIGGNQLRIVLTGAGGGVWPAHGDEVAEVVVDSVDFCRRVANRMPLDELRADISGDHTAATDTLSALANLALD